MTLNFEVITNDGTFIFTEKSEKTLLESLQHNGVSSEHHCQQGFCGACRVKLRSGSVNYTTEPLACLREGEVLTCCSVPCSDITLELDK